MLIFEYPSGKEWRFGFGYPGIVGAMVDARFGERERSSLSAFFQGLR